MNDKKKNHPARPTVYTSAVDLWLAVLLLIAPVLAAGMGIFLWIDENQEGAAILLATAITTLMLTLVLVVPCRYTIEEEDLHIRCGILSYRVPLRTIERVEPSRTLVSGPALSLKRVVVLTRGKNYVLSPRARDAFIEDLSSAADRSRSIDR